MRGTLRGTGLFQFRNKLVAVVGLDGLGIDLDGWAQAGIDQTHHINLLLDVREEIFFREMVRGQQGPPGGIGAALRILFAGSGDAGGDFGVGRVAEVGGLHLLTQQFEVDKAVEDGAAIVVDEAGEGAVAEERFEAQRFIPIGLQNDAAVYGSDNAIDDLRSGDGEGRTRRGEKKEAKQKRERRNRSLVTKFH